MNMISIVSSNIKSIGWQAKVLLENATEPYDILRIEFLSGLIYDYLRVPQDVFLKMMEEESKGSFWHRKIKGKYLELKVK